MAGGFFFRRVVVGGRGQKRSHIALAKFGEHGKMGLSLVLRAGGLAGAQTPNDCTEGPRVRRLSMC